MTLQQYNLFPNVSLVIFPDLMTVLRSRPGPTPDEGYLDVINYRRRSSATPAARPTDVLLPAGSDPGNGAFGCLGVFFMRKIPGRFLVGKQHRDVVFGKVRFLEAFNNCFGLITRAGNTEYGFF